MQLNLIEFHCLGNSDAANLFAAFLAEFEENQMGHQHLTPLMNATQAGNVYIFHSN